MTYIAGDFWRICDRCGFQCRASATAKEWTGAIVCMDCYDEKHPQDYVTGRADHQTVPDPRPEPVANIIGPLTTTLTADASAGATTIHVESTARMLAGDRLGISLASGDTHAAIINTVSNSTQFILTNGTKLPGAALSGALVVDYTAISSASVA